MNTTKETQQHKDKEESKPDPEWFQMDMSKLFQPDKMKRVGELMQEASSALKDYKKQLEEAQK